MIGASARPAVIATRTLSAAKLACIAASNPRAARPTTPKDRMHRDGCAPGRAHMRSAGVPMTPVLPVCDGFQASPTIRSIQPQPAELGAGLLDLFAAATLAVAWVTITSTLS